MLPDAELGVRLSPPEITITGHFDTADVARLEGLAWQTRHALNTLRYVNYDDLEADCRILSSRLSEKLGSSLKTCYFTFIPRGGLIVLGLLSYLLKLEAWQLEPPPTKDSTLVVVDDCCLTGRRFAQFLKKNQSNEIIFVPLYSTPELRSAITKRESRVKACISAHDLEGISDLPDYQVFKENLRSNLDDSYYWVGLTEYLCFAWNEPDFFFWNRCQKK
jgi:hypothetical protein